MKELLLVLRLWAYIVGAVAGFFGVGYLYVEVWNPPSWVTGWVIFLSFTFWGATLAAAWWED